MADKQLRFFGANEEEEKTVKRKSSPQYATKKDVFFMSFLAFMLAGLVFTGALFATGTITGNAVLDLSGEKGVDMIPEGDTVEETTEDVTEEVAEEPVAEENVTEEESTEEATEETAEEEVTEEVVEEEPEDPCGEEIEIALDDYYNWNGKDIGVKLVSGSSAQLSVGGKLRLMSVGQTQEINNLNIKLQDTKGSSVVVIVQC